MIAIVAVDENWGIGKDGGLLISIPEDMKFFKQTTTGGTVVMGRKTLESFPGGNPLKERTNIVLTTDLSYEKEGAIIVHNFDEMDKALEENGGAAEAFVIGGATVYKELLDRCDAAYVTKVFKKFDADAFFPNLDEDKDWEMCMSRSEDSYMPKDGGKPIRYQFLVYCRK